MFAKFSVIGSVRTILSGISSIVFCDLRLSGRLSRLSRARALVFNIQARDRVRSSQRTCLVCAIRERGGNQRAWRRAQVDLREKPVLFCMAGRV